ncbi:penicillin-binding protein 2, partial [Actinotalea sp. JY-7885]|uniref:peptidoglycan D,D-transpeptidase FtsI family protein n=1 Tax=Actinotalea sp. JY-7885 TaxID=2758576 RepID=UPI0021082E50
PTPTRANASASRGTRVTPRPSVARPRTRAGEGPAAARAAAPRVVTLPPPRTGTPRRRQTVLLGLALSLLVLFTGRLVYVQGLQGAEIAAVAMDKRLHTVAIPGDRGDILDRDGDVLATSVERYDLVVNQEQFGQVVPDEPGALETAALEAATRLGEMLGVDPQSLALKLMGTDKFVYLSKGVTPDVYRQVRDLQIAGISGERTTDRLYPEGTTGGNIVGFVGGEGFGQAGLEQVFEDVLAGRPGSETYEQGARGQRIPGGLEELVPAVPGQDVQLTIDRDLQHMAQAALDEQVAATGAAWGVVQVVDVRTGEILVLADSGTTDPNAPTSAAASRAVAAVYEPGSTAKVVAMAAALETGIATPTSQYVVPYQYTTPNGQTFKDSHEHPDEKLTLNGILAQSSNTGTVMVGQNLPPQVRHDYMSRFGFGTKTGVGLPGESRGLLHDAEDWDGRTAYAVLFGQGVGVTTLQSTQVFATLANRGLRVQPHVVAGTYDADGTFHPTPTSEPVQVVSPETADTVLRMLESAVAEGTGSNAAVPGYRIAGKTGTAQAWEEGGVQKIVASFVGIAPADEPRLAVNVALYDPKSSIYGGDVAAPVFSEVTAHALRSLGIPPSGTPPELFATTWE